MVDNSGVTMVERLDSKLSADILLQLMDLASCMAAEKHSGHSSVTAAVDEFYLDASGDDVSVGDVLTLRAKVNRAWGTSMEVGVSVSYEKMGSTSLLSYKLCRAYFTFVSLLPDGSKFRLPPFPEPPQKNINETRRYLEAAERRRIRITRRKVVEAYLDVEDASLTESKEANAVFPSQTAVEKTNLILPSNANHHGFMFGGTMMAWAASAAYVSASRFARGATLDSVDDIAFRQSVRIGDRMIARATVNRSFGQLLEVGVRVERVPLGGEPEHALTAFMVFKVPDHSRVIMPEPGNEGESRRWKMAQGRRAVRLERKTLRQTIQQVPKFSVRNAQLLGYVNVKGLLSVYDNKLFNGWKVLLDESGISLSVCNNDNDVTGIKIECASSMSPSEILEHMLLLEKRNQWDLLIRDMKVVKEIDEHNDVAQCVFVSSPTEVKEFILLRSWRKEASGRVIYAAKSVDMTDDDSVPAGELSRGTVLSSGAVLTPNASGGGGTTITYIVQAASSTLALLKGDIIGNKPVMFKSMLKLKSLAPPVTAVAAVAAAAVTTADGDDSSSSEEEVVTRRGATGNKCFSDALDEV